MNTLLMSKVNGDFTHQCTFGLKGQTIK